MDLKPVTEKLDSKTLWQSVVATLLWHIANVSGFMIPVEALLTLIGAIGVKETAGKLARPAAKH